jgi:hypothetical protein
MKKIAIVACLVILTYWLPQSNAFAQETTTGKLYGTKFTLNNPVPFEQVAAKLKGKDTLALQTEGVVKEVCQAKGCWMKADLGNGKEMMIRFKNYAFFVPTNSVGKKVVLNGVAYQKTLSVAQLQHYAEDAGKSEKEVAKIKKPQTSLQFEADGVLIQD